VYISYDAFKVIRVAISGCWFHFAQAVVKRVNKTGLKDGSINDAHVRDTFLTTVVEPTTYLKVTMPVFDAE